ncbi:DUF6916 family protein [Marinicella litoralis]|uniref:DUF6916 domain-containing protein n=1 Tax=Marinicella litoralis TaxID=644220 RepID=A0A4R6XWB2_9GAMM|nr:hypothetical protein [Marinicella litoralis]TDR22427.1 hypothetical protein C8D91_0916 [Marinicella litoralis]
MSLPDKELFEAHIDDVFEIDFDGQNKSQCHIKEINTSTAPMVKQNSKQFSVVFLTAGPQVYEQGVYAVSHAKLGVFELFLVPVFGDEKEVHYEAVFT